MNDSQLNTITDIEKFLDSNRKCSFKLSNSSIEERYKFINKTIDKYKYWKLSKEEKGILIRYIRKITGYKESQTYKLVKDALHGKLKHKEYNRINTYRKYHTKDIKLLEKTDKLHRRLSSSATRKILEREAKIFNNTEYNNIGEISSSHINNLRKTDTYKSSWINHTKAREINIGKTQKPDNRDLPGCIRIDSVHQRDVYHINAVDEKTQWEIVVCIPELTMMYMEYAIEEIVEQIPFIVFNMHADRGGEYINRVVAELLDSLDIDFTKSRARHSHDNALVESKNGSIIRKNMGFCHVNQELADEINKFYRKYFNIYLNYHRPCAYPTIHRDKRGKEIRVYRAENYEVPYEKLKQMAKKSREHILVDSLSFKKLDKIAYRESDNEFARKMRKAQSNLDKLTSK